MKWFVLAYSSNNTEAPVQIEVEADNHWQAVLAAGRTGLVPMDVSKIEVYSR